MRKVFEAQLVARGIRNPDVLAAMEAVDREQFVPEDLRQLAWRDGPLTIGFGQTISQPYIVACMAEVAELKKTDRVLEVGTGSGYSAAVMSRLVSELHTIERIPELAEQAAVRLKRSDCKNVRVHVGDGSRGLEAFAPWDVIVVTAAAEEIPRPLLNQLAVGGRLVIPVGAQGETQILTRIRRRGRPGSDAEFDEEQLLGVVFVPLIRGEAANSSQEENDRLQMFSA